MQLAKMGLLLQIRNNVVANQKLAKKDLLLQIRNIHYWLSAVVVCCLAATFPHLRSRRQWFRTVQSPWTPHAAPSITD
jgi:hypothetical protein